MPENLPIIISNYDWRTNKKSIEEQIILAQTLFNMFPKFRYDFIIKAPKVLDIDSIIINVKKLRNFHILGLTEKELGSNLIDKLKNIARIRVAMDRESINIPIHIYGGMDPILSVLYFFVGAEIFDGVSWLRYSFKDGYAVYYNAHGILHPTLGLEATDYQALRHRLGHNISFLQQQTVNFKCFVNKKAPDFQIFGTHADCFYRAYKVLSTQIPELKGDI